MQSDTFWPVAQENVELGIRARIGCREKSPTTASGNESDLQDGHVSDISLATAVGSADESNGVRFPRPRPVNPYLPNHLLSGRTLQYRLSGYVGRRFGTFSSEAEIQTGTLPGIPRHSGPLSEFQKIPGTADCASTDRACMP